MDRRSELDALLTAIWESQVVSYVWASGLTVLTYDIISTFPREVTYIWREKWSIPKMLYLSLRYLGLFQLIVYIVAYSTIQTSTKRCQLFFIFAMSIGSSNALLLIVNGILGIRLYALYHQNIKVLWFLWLIFLGEFAIQVFVSTKVGISTVKTAFVPPTGFPIKGCLTAPDLSTIKLAWVTSILVAMICFLMTLAKFGESAREARRSGWRIPFSRISPIVQAFLRDGTVYFLVILVMLIVGAVNSSVSHGPFAVLYEPWMAVAFVVAGSRLVLNLREAASRDFYQSESVFNSAIGGLDR